MADETKSKLKKGEYLLGDPMLLKGMRLSQDVTAPGTQALLVRQYTPLTDKLISQLRTRGVETVFAETIKEKSVVASVEHMEKMFHVIEEIADQAMGDVEDMAEAFQTKQDVQALEDLVRDNLDDIEDLFSSDPTEKLVALTKHHGSTARHSIVASFHMMALGRELGWSDSKIVRAAVAVFNHDVGKTKVKLETLDWPGRLDNEKWKEIQCHPLFGGRLLYRPGKKPDLTMLSALLHHEWYAEVEGKGYGGLTLFVDYLKRTAKLDIRKIVSELSPDDLEIIQAASLVDMVSALEERRSYKRELDSFKVLVIMNSDAKLGHFRPEHFAAWSRIYHRQNPILLPLGLRVALPREKERRLFRPLKIKKVKPTPLLTYYELEQLDFLPALRNVGMDVERIRRRGGLALSVVDMMRRDKKLSFDCSPEAIAAQGVTLMKEVIIPEEQVIELNAWQEWLTVEELEKSGLMGKARSAQLDTALIKKNGGIKPNRLSNRSITLNEKKLERLGIKILKDYTVRLPASENRLTPEDLEKLGVSEADLKKAGCLDRVKKVKSGVPMAWLASRGITFSNADLAKHGIDPIRKVFYDIQVSQQISSTRAKFIFLREGDDLKAVQEASERKELETIQHHLLNVIGEVVMDFSDLVSMPDLSGLRMGRHWGE
ncbi:MAG: hypothetical protein HQL52_16505 [Magnetococcales bacterium]|nr:hypothetical protein [Magnetococcales bacterium]